MLDICNSLADMYDIKFNAKKSLGVKFGRQQVMSEILYILVIVEFNGLVV